MPFHTVRSFALLLGLLAAPIGNAQAQLTLTSNLNLTNAGNLIANGSFETGISSGQTLYWATGTALTPFAVPPGWSSTGGTSAYASWQAGFGNAEGSAPLPDGIAGLYFGNYYVSSLSATPTFNANGTVAFSSAPNITPWFAPYTPAVQLSQTVTGLIPNAVYGLSFWASGEDATSGVGIGDGIFALEVSGYNAVYLAAPGGASSLGAAHVYEFTVVPNATSLTIEFTNWGHFSPAFTAGWSSHLVTTELVLDNVLLKPLAAVPEPGVLALFASTLVAGIGASARRLKP